jgi:hypothetical protein
VTQPIGRLVEHLPARLQRRLDRISEPTADMVRQRLGLDVFIAIGIALVALRLFNVSPWTMPILDLHAYWITRFGVDYDGANPFVIGSYLYSPVFAQVIWPIAQLPWPVFAAFWTGLMVLVYAWLVGRWATPLLLTFAVALELYLGQIDIFLAAAIFIGFRYPAAWAFPLLTKVAPGIGLIWFVVRREWRKLGIAITATVGIAAISAFIDPGAWNSWFDLLRRSVTERQTVEGAYLAIPYAIRLPAAILIIVWGARTDRYWTVPVGVLIGMPILWINVFTLLIAVIPLREEPGLTPAREWLGRVLPLPRAAGAAASLAREPGPG